MRNRPDGFFGSPEKDSELETIEKTGWDGRTGVAVSLNCARPIAGEGAKQSLRDFDAVAIADSESTDPTSGCSARMKDWQQ